jgi:hypothetical protein
MSSVINGLAIGEIYAGGIAEAQARNRERSLRRAVHRAELETARAWAVLGCALKELPPGHPLQIRAVRQKVADAAQSGDPFAAKDAGAAIDLAMVFAAVKREFETKRAEVESLLKQEQPRNIRTGFLWLGSSYEFCSVRFKTEAEADRAKACGIRAAVAARLGDSLEIDDLIKTGQAMPAEAEAVATSAARPAPQRQAQQQPEQQPKTPTPPAAWLAARSAPPKSQPQSVVFRNRQR